VPFGEYCFRTVIGRSEELAPLLGDPRAVSRENGQPHIAEEPTPAAAGPVAGDGELDENEQQKTEVSFLHRNKQKKNGGPVFSSLLNTEQPPLALAAARGREASRKVHDVHRREGSGETHKGLTGRLECASPGGVSEGGWGKIPDPCRKARVSRWVQRATEGNNESSHIASKMKRAGDECRTASVDNNIRDKGGIVNTPGRARKELEGNWSSSFSTSGRLHTGTMHRFWKW